ncbi:MAG: VWA domain-containing protein [Anaerolineae bacterium]
MSFQWPLLLCTLAIIPFLLLIYVLMQLRRRQYTVRFTNLALLREVAPKGPGIRRHIPAVLFVLAIAVLLSALARPQSVIRVPSDNSAVMVVIDISGSMNASDISPTRIEAAKQAAQTFISNLPDNALVGLVSFNNAARLDAALTTDHTQVMRAASKLRADGGTAIGEALELALDELASREPGPDGNLPPGTVVLLSDGASNFGRPPTVAAQRAAQENVHVYTVGIGARGASPLIGGRPVELDESALQAIANTTQGDYFYAQDSSTLEKIYADLSSQVSWKEEKTEVTALFTAFGTVVLLIAAAFSLFWFQRLP